MPFLEPFASTAESEIEKDADLTLYLLDHLEQKRSPKERRWEGERPLDTLQYTSEIAGALHHLGLKGITDHLIEPAADWLLDLPFERDLSPEEHRALRLYPGRFKTLTLIGRFDPARLAADFSALSQLLDPETGWIQEAPLDLNPVLMTVMYVDTLLHVEPLGLRVAATRAKRDRALQAVAEAFGAWAETAAFGPHHDASSAGQQAQLSGRIATCGDASYALDVLLRAGWLLPSSPQATNAREALTTAIHQSRLGEPGRSDLLNCGLHLRAHFPQHEMIHAAVEGLIAGLRERYENLRCQRENIGFHALVLRLLAAHHQAPLPGVIVRTLWARSREAGEARQRLAQQALEAEFAGLVRQSIRIHLAPPQRITGTRERGEVYRLRFGLATEAADEHGVPFSAPRALLRLIVKTGPASALADAIERYRDLPEPLQPLFARHANVVHGREWSSGYLIMQDLADMQPLSEVLAQLDQSRITLREGQDQAAAAARAAASALRALHSFKRQPGLSSHQFNLTYLAPMAEALSRLYQPGAYPELKPWLDGTLHVNGAPYKVLDWYLKQLARFEDRLRCPALGYTHGDCHSRNLMLSQDRTSAVFVDIDTLTNAEDYMVDYGLLVEDIAVYQSLPYGDEPGRLEWDDIRTALPGDPVNASDHSINYPPFPQRSEVALLFQRTLMEQLAEFAAALHDQDWKPRLWLATARGLLLLASRQLTSHAVAPRRRSNRLQLVNDLKLAQVAYAEALRLLSDLCAHLDQGEAPLPDLPFPGGYWPAAHGESER